MTTQSAMAKTEEDGDDDKAFVDVAVEGDMHDTEAHNGSMVSHVEGEGKRCYDSMLMIERE